MLAGLEQVVGQSGDELLVGGGFRAVGEIAVPEGFLPEGPAAGDGSPDGTLHGFPAGVAKIIGQKGVKLLGKPEIAGLGVQGDGNAQVAIAVAIDGDAQVVEHSPCLLHGIG